MKSSIARVEISEVRVGLSYCGAQWVDFDEKAEITVEGTVTAFYFVNPHCVVELDVKNEKGQVQKWQGEF